MKTPEHSKTDVITYHNRTKHFFDKYAAGPETIDWDSLPDSFRVFEGAKSISLPLQDEDQAISYASLFESHQQPVTPWNLASLSQLLQYSLGLAAWKQFGASRWSLRCNPSSGNLHPTECYIIAIGIPDTEDGLYHYRVDNHSLELRCSYSNISARSPYLGLALSSVPWREAWKYGERAFRYCQLDAGHAAAAVAYSACVLGYQVKRYDDASQGDLDLLLGTDRRQDFHVQEREHAELFLSFLPCSTAEAPSWNELLSASRNGEWHGKANLLDSRHFYDWPIIDQVIEASALQGRHKNEAEYTPHPEHLLPPPETVFAQESALKLIRQRRSAQAFDKTATMAAINFFRLLERVMPYLNQPPWSGLGDCHQINLLLFVHAVEGLAPGLYFLVRNPQELGELKTRFKDSFLWEPVAEAPSPLPLYHLLTANARKAAQQLSCHQAIAGDSIFSLGMIAKFSTSLNATPWHYRELLQEAGAIGQSLYLEAEASGFRGTGIGCFFDDAVHQLLGVTDNYYQSVYHFTVGRPIDDSRLVTLSPYFHLAP
ncbi:MAG: SagB/ThcOx family dehydrogenase [Thiotrichales bacterium]